MIYRIKVKLNYRLNSVEYFQGYIPCDLVTIWQVTLAASGL
jgi:hypothetical protein